MHTSKATLVTLILLLSTIVKAKSVPIGTVSSCKAAAIQGANLVPGATVFSGDTIDVGPQGNVWIAVQGGGQVQVLANSTVLLTKSPDWIEVTVDRGLAQTTSKGIVIKGNFAQVGQSQTGAKVDPGKLSVRTPPAHSESRRGDRQHEDRDCDVSKDSRRIRPCRGDID